MSRTPVRSAYNHTITVRKAHVRLLVLILQMTFLCLMIPAPHLFAQWVQTSAPNAGDVSVLVTSGQNLFAGTKRGGVFLSTNNGTNWIAINNGLTSAEIWTLATDGTNLFAGTYPGGVFLSTNNGANWTQVNTGLTDTSVGSLALAGLGLFASTFRDGIFLSTNNGTTWTPVNNGLTDYLLGPLAVLGANVFVGGVHGIFRSTNNGSNWSQTGLTNADITCLAVSGSNLFAGADIGALLSADSGASWMSVNSGLTTFVRTFAVSGSNIFAGMYDDGIYLSTNNGTSWTSVNDGLTNPNIRSLAVLGTDLFAGTDNGVWKRPLAEIVSSVEGFLTDLPAEFKLNQNYPNPFNPTTTIRFALPKSQRAQLRVYNTLGQEVATLVNEDKPAGTYSIEWNAGTVASGVYFYQLKAGGYSATRKLLLLK